MDHLRAWFLGQQPVTPEKPTKPREQRDAQRAAAACGPKPVAEAVGDALSAVGELVAAIQAKKKSKHGHGGAKRATSKRKTSSRRRAASSRRPVATKATSTARPAARGVVVVEEVRVLPRAGSRTRAPRRGPRATFVTDAPIVVAPSSNPLRPGDAAEERG